MTIRLWHLVVAWLLVILVVTVVPHRMMTTHPNMTVSGLPFDALAWQGGEVTVYMSGIVLNSFIFSAPFALAALWMVYSRGKSGFRRGYCPQCGYDLRGLDGNADCPECGAVVDH